MSKRVYRINARTLLRHMKMAEKVGVNHVRFKVGPYSFAHWPIGDNDQPSLYVSYHGSDSTVYLGRIVRNKLFPQETFRLRRDLRAIRAFVENPLAAAQAVASTAERPVCACCDRPLGTRDVKVGIGERCFEKWQWATVPRTILRRGRRNGRASRS